MPMAEAEFTAGTCGLDELADEISEVAVLRLWPGPGVWLWHSASPARGGLGVEGQEGLLRKRRRGSA